MMKFLALSMFFSILALHVVSATFLTGWSSCGEETDWFNLSEMDLEPPPPILSGKNITVVLGGHLSTPIVDGTNIVLVAKLGFIPLLYMEYAICDFAQCPISVGPLTLRVVADVPSSVPSLSITAVLTANDPASGDEIFCVNGPMDVKHPYMTGGQETNPLAPKILKIDISR